MKSGDVVLLKFPFSDLVREQAAAGGYSLQPRVANDFVACQVTTSRDAAPDCYRIDGNRVSWLWLKTEKLAQPWQLFTAPVA